MHEFIDWWLDTTVGPFTVADLAGFTTGALCVWLVVRQHVANFPIGIALPWTARHRIRTAGPHRLDEEGYR